MPAIALPLFGRWLLGEQSKCDISIAPLGALYLHFMPLNLVHRLSQFAFKSSPRWVSMLVAEIFYPNVDETTSTTSSPAPPVQDFQAYQQYLQKRAGASSNDGSMDPQQANAEKAIHCDGYDEIGDFHFAIDRLDGRQAHHLTGADFVV